MFFAAPAAAGAAGWLKPQTIVPVGTATYNPAVATAPDGTTVVVWDEANSLTGKFRLLTGIRLPSGKIKIRKLGAMSGAFPQASIAVGGDGTFAVVWGYPAKGSRSRTAVRVWPSGKHGFGRTMFLSPGNASTEQSEGDTPQVAVDDTGTVYVVWEGQYGKGAKRHYQVVERELAKHAKRWSSPRRLSAMHAKKALGPKQAHRLAVRKAHLRELRGFVAWFDWRTALGRWKGLRPMERDARPRVPRHIPHAWRLRYHHRVRTLAKHHHWSSPRRLSAATVDSHGARVAADGNGNVAVSWTEASGAVEAAVRPAGARRFGKAQLISRATYGFGPPTVAESDHGKSALVWEQSVLSGRRIESKVANGHKFPRRGQFLSGKGTAQFQALSLASDGSGVTAWEKTAGSGGQVLARVITPRGKRWTNNVAKLTRAGVFLLGTGPSAAANNGHAFVAWGQRIKTSISIGVKVLVGRHWLKTRTFPALQPPVVSAANDPVGHSRVLGTVVWTSTKGLQIAIFR